MLRVHDDLNQAGFERVAESTFAEMGLAPDRDSLHYADDENFWTVEGQDATGLNDVQIYTKHGQSNMAAAVQLHSLQGSESPCYLRGLLWSMQGSYWISLGSGDQDSSEPLYGVGTQVRSSPQAINAAQVTLGRDPGEDAFKLVRHDDKGQFPSGEWVKGFAGMTVPVAGLKEWMTAKHDTDPDDHVQSWISTPPVYCRSMAARAQAIADEFGDRITSEDDDRPEEVDEFARAADGLARFTRPIFEQVVGTAMYGGQGESIDEQVRSRFHALYAGTSHREGVSILPVLGITKMKFGDNRFLQEVSRIQAVYFGFIAGLLLNLDEVRPIHHEPKFQRAKRQQLLTGMVEFGTRAGWK